MSFTKRCEKLEKKWMCQIKIALTMYGVQNKGTMNTNVKPKAVLLGQNHVLHILTVWTQADHGVMLAASAENQV